MFFVSVAFVTPDGVAIGTAFNRSPKKAWRQAADNAEDELLSGKFGGCPSVGMEWCTMLSPYGRRIYSGPLS